MVVAAPNGLSVRPVETGAADDAAGAAAVVEPPTDRRGLKNKNKKILILINNI